MTSRCIVFYKMLLSVSVEYWREKDMWWSLSVDVELFHERDDESDDWGPIKGVDVMRVKLLVVPRKIQKGLGRLMLRMGKNLYCTLGFLFFLVSPVWNLMDPEPDRLNTGPRHVVQYPYPDPLIVSRTRMGRPSCPANGHVFCEPYLSKAWK